MSLNEFQPAESQAPGGASPPDALHLDLLAAIELQIVHHVARGCTNAEIAKSLGKSESAIKKRLQSIYAKLGVRNRVLLLARLFEE